MDYNTCTCKCASPYTGSSCENSKFVMWKCTVFSSVSISKVCYLKEIYHSQTSIEILLKLSLYN